MKHMMIITAAAALALPAAAFAETAPTQVDRTNAAQQCRAQRTAMGVSAFRALYGTSPSRSNAFGRCVARMARLNSEARSAARAACQAEQNDANFASTHGGKTFGEFYGTGKNGKNAFARCVSSKAKAAHNAQQSAIVNAARTCKAEQRANREAFRRKYGTNRYGRNAFGRCVATHARQP